MNFSTSACHSSPARLRRLPPSPTASTATTMNLLVLRSISKILELSCPWQHLHFVLASCFRLPINLKSKIFIRCTALVALAAKGPVDTFQRLRRDDQLWSHLAVSTPHCQPPTSTTGVATSTISKVRWLPSHSGSKCSLQSGTCRVKW